MALPLSRINSLHIYEQKLMPTPAGEALSHRESDTTSFLNPDNSWKTGHKSPQIKRPGSSISCPSLSAPGPFLSSAQPFPAWQLKSKHPKGGTQKLQLQHPGKRVQAGPADLWRSFQPVSPCDCKPRRFLYPTRRCHHCLSSQTQQHQGLTRLCLTASCCTAL